MPEPTEEQIETAAKILAETPMIDAPRGLGFECWCGLARSILIAALSPDKRREE